MGDSGLLFRRSRGDDSAPGEELRRGASHRRRADHCGRPAYLYGPAGAIPLQFIAVGTPVFMFLARVVRHGANDLLSYGAFGRPRGLGRACLCVSIYPVAVCRVFACLLFCGLERISCVISGNVIL